MAGLHAGVSEMKEVTEEQKSGARKTVLTLGLVVVTIYVGFYLMVLAR